MLDISARIILLLLLFVVDSPRLLMLLIEPSFSRCVYDILWNRSSLRCIVYLFVIVTQYSHIWYLDQYDTFNGDAVHMCISLPHRKWYITTSSRRREQVGKNKVRTDNDSCVCVHFALNENILRTISRTRVELILLPYLTIGTIAKRTRALVEKRELRKTIYV